MEEFSYLIYNKYSTFMFEQKLNTNDCRFYIVIDSMCNNYVSDSEKLVGFQFRISLIT